MVQQKKKPIRKKERKYEMLELRDCFGEEKLRESTNDDTEKEGDSERKVSQTNNPF